MKLTDEELNLHFLLFFILYLFGGGYMYNIGEVSEKYGIPVSTLRYYDKEVFSKKAICYIQTHPLLVNLKEIVISFSL